MAPSSLDQNPGAVKPNLLRDQVAALVKDAILRGEWKAGETLPSQAKLAETYSVSVATTREALQSLAAQGLVNIIHGRGSVVLPPDFSHALEMLKMTAGRKTTRLVHVWELRCFLEPNIAALAAERAAPEQIAALETIVSQLDPSNLDVRARAQSDLEFHEALASATGNPVLELTIQVFSALYLEGLEVSASVGPAAPDDHLMILRAVRARDPIAARAAMNSHLAHTKEGILIAEGDLSGSSASDQTDG